MTNEHAQAPTDDRPVVDFDHHSVEYRDRSHEIFSEVRSKCPVSWTNAHGGYWFATDYDSVYQAARDAEVFTSWKDVEDPSSPRRGGLIPDVHPDARQGFSEMDGPAHLRLRQAFAKYFTPAAAEKERAEVRADAAWCVDQFIERGSADLANELAAPVPAMWAMRMLGLPPQDWRRFAEVAHQVFYVLPGAPEYDALAEKRQWMNEQLMHALEERRAEPQNDLISVVANLQLDGQPISESDTLGTMQLLVHGGLDTTTNLIGHSLVHLSANPDAMAWLAEDHSRLHSACEEYLRVFTPVQGIARTVTERCTLGGQQLEPNDRIWLMWAAGNLDPDAFEDPEQIKLDRFPNRHLSFAVGPHRCIGSSFARMMWEVVIIEVLQRLGDFRIDMSNATRYPTIGVMNGWGTLPATFTPGATVGAKIEGNH